MTLGTFCQEHSLMQIPPPIRWVALLLVLSSTGNLAAQTETKQAKQLKAWLKRYPDADADKDGILTLEEARQYRDNVLKKRRDEARRQLPKPSYADVKYGSHARNVFDLWLPAAAPVSGCRRQVGIQSHTLSRTGLRRGVRELPLCRWEGNAQPGADARRSPPDSVSQNESG